MKVLGLLERNTEKHSESLVLSRVANLADFPLDPTNCNPV